jgi:transposase
MIRMLVVRYVFAIRSERLICREVQVNLAYRWFCKLGIEDTIPDLGIHANDRRWVHGPIRDEIVTVNFQYASGER